MVEPTVVKSKHCDDGDEAGALPTTATSHSECGPWKVTLHSAAVHAPLLNELKSADKDTLVLAHSPSGAGVIVSSPAQFSCLYWMAISVGAVVTVLVVVTVIVMEGVGTVVVAAATPMQEHALEYLTLPEHAEA
jgi:hypothetical protein